MTRKRKQVHGAKKHRKKKPRLSNAQERRGAGPFLASFLIVLPQPLSIDHGLTWTHELDDVIPWLKEADIYIADGHEPQVSGGHNIVSLKFWQAKDTFAPHPDLARRTYLASRVLQALTGKEISEDSGQADLALDMPFVTVVEAVTIVTGPQHDIAAALDHCLEVLMKFHQAYRLLTVSPIQELTYERLHPMVPWTRRDLDGKSSHTPMGIILLESGNFTGPVTEALSSEQMGQLAQLYSRADAGDPFIQFVERRVDAAREITVEGNYSQSLIECAMAAEVLFDALLSALMWEEGTDPENAAKVLGQELRHRIKGNEYSKRLGGNWSQNTGELRDWRIQIADVRNRVVHGGYKPTRNEVEDALSALQGLATFVGDRLVEKHKKYPRTAFAFLGHEGLEKRGRIKALESLSASDTDDLVEWFRGYRRWREETVKRRSTEA